MKKLLAVLIVLVLAFCLAACGQPTTEPADTPADTPAEDKAGDYKIGMTANNVGTDAYQTKYDTTIRAYAEELGLNFVCLDAGGDVTTQLEQVENLITQGCDVIIIWPVNGESLVPACQACYDEGIPVVITNSNIAESGYDYIKCFVGPNNVIEANYAGEMMMEFFPDGADIVCITGLPGYTTAIEREDGFMDVIKGSNINVLDSQPGDWNREKAQKQMENFLLKYDKIDAVYACDDNMAIGCINAIEAAGRMDEIKVISCCAFGDDEGLGYVKDGRIAGSVLQSPMEDAKSAIDIAIKVAEGEDVEFFNYINTPKLTLDTLSTLDIPAWD